MNHPFLIRPAQLHQAFESGSSSGAGNGLTRRAFIKRTGGATVAAMVAWNLQVGIARAVEESGTSSGFSVTFYGYDGQPE